MQPLNKLNVLRDIRKLSILLSGLNNNVLRITNLIENLNNRVKELEDAA